MHAPRIHTCSFPLFSYESNTVIRKLFINVFLERKKITCSFDLYNQIWSVPSTGYEVVSSVICTTAMSTLFVLLMRTVRAYGKQLQPYTGRTSVAGKKAERDRNNELFFLGVHCSFEHSNLLFLQMKLTKTVVVTMAAFFIFYFVPVIGIQTTIRFMS
jgi:hypothetical protein